MRYQTEYGMIKIDVLTESLEKDVDVKTPAGHFSVKYQLKQAGQLIGSYQLELQFAA